MTTWIGRGTSRAAADTTAAFLEWLDDDDDHLYTTEQPEECQKKTEANFWRDLMSQFVCKESSWTRKCWDLNLAFMLVYTAWIFPYRMCFIEMKIPEPTQKSWRGIFFEGFVDTMFYIDLVINFFFTYRGRDGREVANVKKIAQRYLRSFFVVNLIGCIPPELFQAVLQLAHGGEGNSAKFHKAARLLRMQRASRLLRMLRLLRLMKMDHFFKHNTTWKWIQNNIGGIRLVNFFFGFFTVAHIMACGWYMVAVFLEEKYGPEEHWLARRGVREESGFAQWLTSLYFVFTVFTTVGFGDMSAFNSPEIGYVIVVMMVGALVNSIFVSEVVSVVTHVDETERGTQIQKELVGAFIEHVGLQGTIKERMISLSENRVRRAEMTFDRHSVRDMLAGDKIPREVLESLPVELFDGRLLQNRLIRYCQDLHSTTLPPRFSLMLALLLSRHTYCSGDAVYYPGDHSFSVYMVLSGTFAAMAIPTAAGGKQKSLEFAPQSTEGRKLSTELNGSATTTDPPPNQWELCGCANKETVGPTLYPYHLFSHGQYFGDFEIMGTLRDQRRHSYMRCLIEGECLLLLKKDMERFEKEFPQFTHLWYIMARRREWSHQRKLDNLTQGAPMKTFAIQIIQRAFRKKRLWKATHGTRSGVEQKWEAAYGNEMSCTVALNSEVKLEEEVASLDQQVRQELADVKADVKAFVAAIRDTAAKRHASVVREQTAVRESAR